MYIDYLNTPLGEMEIQATEAGVAQVIFCGQEKKAANPSEITRRCCQQLSEYITEEIKLIPGKLEFIHFSDQISQLSSQLAALEQRIEKLR